jgi:predicted ArsR family transcriptional regulator
VRSIFLSHLIILDSLATRRERPTNIRKWLDEKITEVQEHKDDALASAIKNLKQESHGTAIKNLIERAGRAMGERGEEIKARQNLAAKLYAVRSGLAHSGTKTLDPENMGMRVRWHGSC